MTSFNNEEQKLLESLGFESDADCWILNRLDDYIKLYKVCKDDCIVFKAESYEFYEDFPYNEVCNKDDCTLQEFLDCIL